MNNESEENNVVRVLLVDDSLLMRTMVEELLVEAGFRVFTAVDGIDAWKKLQNETVQVVVADINMPRLDGLQLTKMVRADEQLRKLPIILISATDTNEDRRRGLIYGATMFITKERRQLESLAASITKLLSEDT